MPGESRRELRDALHDLRQPASALRLYAEWLDDDRALADELAPKLLRAARAVEVMLDAALNLTRLDAGQGALSSKPVDVRELLCELEAQFEPLAAQKGLALRARSLRTSVTADPIVLRRILGNLVSNAIRYTERGGVLLAARRRGEAIGFEVWDTGVGIAEAEQARVFEDFYRAPPGAAGDGLGLGLAIVRRLAARAGWPVALYSRPGRGTLVRLLVA
ncbi:MAG: HAMP domain-containing sensor histidine kinase [Ottowia sp.]|uniref:sensor histidine kinase n=1 Tax=Ottowia sp. TaxID=1898956 RepID=UPI0039E38AA3